MSKLTDIMDTLKVTTDGNEYWINKVSLLDAERAIVHLIQDLIDETFDKDDKKALELWEKVKAL